MTDTTVVPETHDYSKTLFLPQTDFPMRAGLPQREPEILARWYGIGLYERLRQTAGGDPRFILHDGPPYANGNIHIGHALNKILKDLVTRSQQMLGYDSNYVPGWDCHGLPIEWKIEEQYRAKGLDKDQVPILEFRAECRAFAAHWVDVQREEFKRLGVIGDWDDPYLTMSFPAEAQIARELMKFAGSGQLYRGSKPVMWSIVERTALAEAEVEYQEHVSTTIFVKFPLVGAEAVDPRLADASVVIWTTTPWTIPANRAIAYSNDIPYGLYEVTAAPEGNWAKPGDRYLLADGLAEGVLRAAKVETFSRVMDVPPELIARLAARHPLHAQGYTFGVPLLAADYVTADTGTGFVHTAPGHGADDYGTFVRNRAAFATAGTPDVPHTVRPDGAYFEHVPVFAGARVFDDQGKEGDANARVIAALAEAGMLIARGKLRHSYPHSWRSKAPLIFRNTPQWFIAMDKELAAAGTGDTLRHRALTAIKETQWVPAAAEHRIFGMVENRPDWVISRQRAWGVPITVFVDKESGEILLDERVNARIADAFEAEGADAWFADPTGVRFLAPDHDPERFEKVDDVLDVWFDSGSTHAFTLEQRDDLKTRRRPPGSKLAPLLGGKLHDQVAYLEGTDQHRGFFHSSLLESCGTRGRAPYDVVVTHGFTLDEQGRKMSKSLGNTVAPQDVIRQSGADILRLWTASVDYWDDQRIGPEVLKSVTDQYRKVRNSLRWMLGSLHHFSGHDIVPVERMPELERLMLHRLVELDQVVREAYMGFDYKRIVTTLAPFLTGDLSAFYFDIRKDALYCDPISSTTRRGALTVIDQIFRCVSTWLAPVLSFTTEEAWLSRFPDATSVHLERFPIVPATWRDDALAEKWAKVRRVRRVVTGALEIERANKAIGSSLEAAPIVHVSDTDLQRALSGIDLAEVCITSAISVVRDEGPAGAFRLDDVAGVAVEFARAEGRKCARSWKISPEVGSDAEFPDITPRDAKAMREWLKAQA